MNINVIGKRVLVEKEKIDAGGLRLSPTMEGEGQKNKGKIVGVGQIPAKYELLGIKEGATIYFRKHFTANFEDSDPLVFVNLDEILGIETF